MSRPRACFSYARQNNCVLKNALRLVPESLRFGKTEKTGIDDPEKSDFETRGNIGALGQFSANLKNCGNLSCGAWKFDSESLQKNLLSGIDKSYKPRYNTAIKAREEKTMARRDIERIIEKMKIPYNSPVKVMDIYNGIMDYCRENQTPPTRHAWTLDNGVLLVDGVKLLRVAPIERRPYSAEADYWEGQILARQERFCD